MSAFTFGDSVGLPGTVCGVRKIETNEQVREFQAPLGTTIYLVEFGDGRSIEIAERFLTPLPQDI